MTMMSEINPLPVVDEWAVLSDGSIIGTGYTTSTALGVSTGQAVWTLAASAGSTRRCLVGDDVRMLRNDYREGADMSSLTYT